MSKSLKQRTIMGMIWSFIQKFGTTVISFIANLFLARLLSPADFGIIGMLMVFIALSISFVDGGFGSALIQKKNPTNTDYSTIFYWNILLSVLLYLLLFFLSPAIANFYKMPMLDKLLKVLGIILPINSFNLIQSNILRKALNFRVLAMRDLIATTIGVIVGIIMALKGFGVWSLVANTLITGIVKSILLWTKCEWRPLFIFSWASFKSLFKFGSFIFLSNITETIFINIQKLIIGKVFSAANLGYYTQAAKLENIPVSTLSTTINQVTYPIFSTLQDDLYTLKVTVKKNIKAVIFIAFPLMAMLFVIAKPLILLLYTDKWTNSIVIFQVLCVAGMMHTLNTINTNIVVSVGHSKLYFNIQLIKRIIGLIIVFIGLQFGFMGIIWAIVVYNYIYFFINTCASHKVINYGTVEQIKDLGKEFLTAIVAGIITYFSFNRVHLPNFLHLMFQVLTYIGAYLSISYLFKIEGLFIYKEIIVKMIKRERKKRKEKKRKGKVR